MQLNGKLSRLTNEMPFKISSRSKSFLKTVKALANSVKIRVSDWNSLKIPPTVNQLPLKNRYIPLSKRFLFREVCSDSQLIIPTGREFIENIALFLDDEITNQYRLISEETMILFQPLAESAAETLSTTDSVIKKRNVFLGQKERLDNEYWFLRKLEELAPAGGFSEISQEALRDACLPRPSRSAQVKTYVDPADYDVLRVWTRGLHPACMYPLDRSLKQRPPDDDVTISTLTTKEGAVSAASSKRQHRLNSLNKWLERLTRLVSPKSLPLVPSDHLCYNHVLLAYRLRGDKKLSLRMLRHVPVSPTASGNLFAEGVIDMLPAHRFAGLSEGARGLVVASGAVAAVGLGVLTPAVYLLAGGSPTSEVILAWCLCAATTTGAVAALTALRYWKARADWSERLRKLSLVCEFNSGSFALAHFFGLSQAELFKSALLVYALLLQPTECKSPLKRSQLEIRAESWVAKRLFPHSHIGLPASSEASPPSSSLMGRLRRRLPSLSHSSTSEADVFSGGSGPFFDLQFDAGPALSLLRELNLVQGSDEEGLEVTDLRPNPTRGSGKRQRLTAMLSPECQEDDLGRFPITTIRQ